MAERVEPVITGVLTASKVPTIAGTAKNGKTLTASSAGWSAAGMTLRYTWWAGTPTAHASTWTLVQSGAAKTLKMTWLEQGETIFVTVTGHKQGDAKAESSRSKATAIVKERLDRRCMWGVGSVTHPTGAFRGQVRHTGSVTTSEPTASSWRRRIALTALLLGALAAIIGAGVVAGAHGRMERLTAVPDNAPTAVGTLHSHVRVFERGSRGRFVTRYCPVYEFTYAGQHYRGRSISDCRNSPPHGQRPTDWTEWPWQAEITINVHDPAASVVARDWALEREWGVVRRSWAVAGSGAVLAGFSGWWLLRKRARGASGTAPR